VFVAKKLSNRKHFSKLKLSYKNIILPLDYITKIRKLNSALQRKARRDKEESVKRTCTEIETANRVGKARDLFKKIKMLTTGFIVRSGGLKSKTGSILGEKERVKARWKDYTEIV